MASYAVRCEVCNEIFRSNRSHAKFCSARCRTRKYRHLLKAKEPVFVYSADDAPTYGPADVPTYDETDFEDLDYVSPLIAERHAEFIGRRGTNGARIIHPITEKR